MKTIIAVITLIISFGITVHPDKVLVTENKVANAFFADESTIKTGDIIFRSGKGFISDMFRKTSASGSPYSHAGIAVIEENEIFVYHTIGSSGKPDDGIKKEKLSEFCHSRYNSGYAIYRYRDIEANQNKVQHLLDEMLASKIKFDDKFNMETDDAQYCTEFIYKIILRVSGKTLPVSEFNGQTYVSIDNLYLNPFANKITEVNYNQHLHEN